MNLRFDAYLYFTLISLLMISCREKYKRTSKVCDAKLYVEVFNVNPAGVDVHYLTDSLNFRFYVGKFDNEHQNFSYYCKNDSVIIRKLETIDLSGERKIMQTRVFNLQELRKSKVFE